MYAAAAAAVFLHFFLSFNEKRTCNNFLLHHFEFRRTRIDNCGSRLQKFILKKKNAN